jgi:hypothetical protein
MEIGGPQFEDWVREVTKTLLQKVSKAWWLTPEIPATQGAEVGGS